MPRKKIIFLIIGAFLLSLSSIAGAVEIEEIKADPAYPNPEISHSDIYFIYNLDKDQTKKDGLRVENLSDQPKKIKIYSVDVIVTQEGIFNPLSEQAPKKDVGGWIEFKDSELSLEPKEEKIIPFTITIPKEAGVGDHLGAMIIEKDEPPTKTPSGALIKKRAGIRVYERVPGDIKKILKISNVTWKIGFKNLSPNPSLKERVKSILGFTKIGAFDLELRNEGNTHLRPKANVEVTNIFGKRVFNLENVSLKDSQPRGTTLISIEWPNLPLFGRFKAIIDVFFEDNQKISSEISFLITPWNIIAVILLLIIILIFIKFFWKLIYLKRKLKKEVY